MTGEQVDVDDYVTIYSNGPIRGTSSGRPFIMGSAPGSPITNMKEFMEKLKWVLSYLKKKIGKDVFDITTKVPLEELVKTDTKGFFSMLFRREPAKFLEWLDKQEQLVAKEALKSIDLKDFIEEDPVKAASILRKYYNVPEITLLIHWNVDIPSEWWFIKLLSCITDKPKYLLLVFVNSVLINSWIFSKRVCEVDYCRRLDLLFL